MANEISVTVAATLVNGNLRRRVEPGTKQITQTAQGQHGSTVALTTAITQLTVGSVTTYGYAHYQNVSGSGVIYLGPHSTTLVNAIELRAGEVAIFRVVAGTTMAARTVSGSANLLQEIWQD